MGAAKKIINPVLEVVYKKNAKELDYNFQSLEDEMSTFESMTEEEACDWYGIDFKEEARQAIIDYWHTDKEEFEEGWYMDFCYENFN